MLLGKLDSNQWEKWVVEKENRLFIYIYIIIINKYTKRNCEEKKKSNIFENPALYQ